MLRFSRSDDPPPGQKARVVDGAGAKTWLAGMARPVSVENLQEITQVLLALGALGVQQDGAESLAPERTFAIAERIRGVLLPTLSERDGGDRFAGLPHGPDFAAYFWTIVDAVAALRDVYAWLVSQLAATPVLSESTLMPGGPAGHPAPTSLVSGVGALHRALDVDAQLLTWIQRGRWPVPTASWERHCVLGQLVRDLDCQDVEVADALRLSITKTCRAAFAMPVLIALADPSACGSTEFEVVRMAAQRWAAKVGYRLERRPDARAPGAPAARVVPSRPVGSPGPTLTLGGFQLRLDTQTALASLDKRLDALTDGQTPRDVGIGDGLRPDAARSLLGLLRQRWGAVLPADIDSPDRTWRAAAPDLQVIAMVGVPAATGRRSAGDAGGPTYTYRGAVVTRPRAELDQERFENLLRDAETWTLDAEAPDAVRCIRHQPRPRIGLQRLIGLRLRPPARPATSRRPTGPTPFLMGWVEALQCEPFGPHDEPPHSGAHTIRVRLAPGLPQLLHASIDDVAVDGVFLLVPGGMAQPEGRPGRAPVFVPMLTHPGPDPSAPTSGEADGWSAVRASPRDYGLILPHATFRQQRLVKAARHGQAAMLRLDELMKRGADFDLVRFTPL